MARSVWRGAVGKVSGAHHQETRWPPTLLFLLGATGLVPCPTLSIVIGLALMVGGFGSTAWSLVLGATGIFYGALGAARLGVTIDWVLMAGALMISSVALIGNYKEVWFQFG